MTITKQDYRARYGPWGEVYTHITPDGVNLTLGIHPLRDAIRTAKLRVEMVHLDEAQAKHIIDTDSVELAKVQEILHNMLEKRRPLDPVIHCIREDSTGMLVDGHHRYVLAWLLEMKNVPSYVCYPALWRQFVITDLTPLTKDQLRASPHPSNFRNPPNGS